MKLRITWGCVLTLLFSCLTAQLSQSTSQAFQTMTNYGSIVTQAHIVYHESSFSYTQPPEFDSYVPWSWLPPPYYPCEKGRWGWVSTENFGGNMYLIPDPVDSTRAALKMVWDVAGYTGGNRHVKLYELQGRTLAKGGSKESYDVEPFISRKEAYYHFKVWFPSNTTIGGWRLIWQYCGEEGVYGHKTFPPQARLVFEGNNLNLVIQRYYYADDTQRRWTVTNLAEIPKDEWVQFVVFYKQGSAFQVEDGTIIVWINEVKKFERQNLPTSTESGTPFAIWGIGLYGRSSKPLGQVQLFKDIKVTSSLDTSGVDTSSLDKALPWEDSFESGDFSVWEGTQVSDRLEAWATITSTYAYRGSYSANFTVDGTIGSYSRLMHTVSDFSEVYMRSYVRFEDLPDTNDSVLWFHRIAQSDGTFIAAAGVHKVNTNYNWIIQHSDSVMNETRATINPDTWYGVEFYFNATKNGSATLWVYDDGETKMCEMSGDYSSYGPIGIVYPYIYAGGWNGSQQASKALFHDDFVLDDKRIGFGALATFQTTYCVLTDVEDAQVSFSSLENVRINGTRLTDASGYYEWVNLAYNKVYTFVVEKPAGYYPGWVLNVEGNFSWNGTHYLISHNVTEMQTDPIEIYFFPTEEVYIKSSTEKLTSVYYNSSYQNPHTFLRFNIDADLGVTSRIEIYTADEGHPRPHKIEGAPDWSYDSESKVLTVWILHTIEEEAEIEWRGAAMGH